MATGFCPALLASIDDIAGQNAPGNKLGVNGFLAALFCCQNSNANLLNDAYNDGHTRPMTVKYRTRSLPSQVQTEDDCDVNRIPAYAEWTVPGVAHHQHSQFLDDATIQQYCIDASRQRAVGGPPTQVMMEVYTLIKDSMQVVLRRMNQTLVTSMATQFGDNVVTGSNTGKVINIPSSGDTFNLSNGITDILMDLLRNEICGETCIVGGGLMAAYNINQAAACCNQAGIDMSRLNLPRFWYDNDTQNIWGTNAIGVLAPGSVKLLTRNKYVGAFAGQRGSSFFTTIALPVQEFQGCPVETCLSSLVFDLQLRYIDCPTVITVNGVNQTVNRGWQIIVSKEFALWVQPTSGYESGDELEGTNGTLKYYISNTTYTGSSYAHY
jgi:hypothetical protein